MVWIGFLITLISSVVGSICGIGPGVIVKPVLDLMEVGSTATISFISGCTVLGMTVFSVGKNIVRKKGMIDYRRTTLLSLGAIAGGFLGKRLFVIAGEALNASVQLMHIQSIILFAITIFTFVYTIFKNKVRSYQVKSPVICIVIGMVLGMISGFIGVGAGPAYLLVLFFFFSMNEKVAAQNSLYIILFSQLSSLFTSIFTNTVPEFDLKMLCSMIMAAIAGGMIGQTINIKLDTKMVNTLFKILLIVISAICVYNFMK